MVCDMILTTYISVFCFLMWHIECYVKVTNSKLQLYSELLFILSKIVCIPDINYLYVIYAHMYFVYDIHLTCVYVMCICFSFPLFCFYCTVLLLLQNKLIYVQGYSEKWTLFFAVSLLLTLMQKTWHPLFFFSPVFNKNFIIFTYFTSISAWHQVGCHAQNI